MDKAVITNCKKLKKIHLTRFHDDSLRFGIFVIHCPALENIFSTGSSVHLERIRLSEYKIVDCIKLTKLPYISNWIDNFTLGNLTITTLPFAKFLRVKTLNISNCPDLTLTISNMRSQNDSFTISNLIITTLPE